MFSEGLGCGSLNIVAARSIDAVGRLDVPVSGEIGEDFERNTGRHSLGPSGEEIAQLAAVVECSFSCLCEVDVGMCDEQEVRSELCFEPADRRLTAPSCGVCLARAKATCALRSCPLAPAMFKVAGRFSCPA